VSQGPGGSNKKEGNAITKNDGQIKNLYKVNENER